MDFQLRGVKELKSQMFMENIRSVEASNRLACLVLRGQVRTKEGKTARQVD